MAEGPAEQDAAEAGARRLGRRIAARVVIAVAVLFIASSSAQIIRAVFGLGVRPLPPGPPGSSARICAIGIRSAAGLPSDDAGGRRAKAELEASSVPAPKPHDFEAACAASPEGLDAWASLLRFEQTVAQIPHAPPEAVIPLRQELIAHLPADLR
jgi:hypothetical protein